MTPSDAIQFEGFKAPPAVELVVFGVGDEPSCTIEVRPVRSDGTLGAPLDLRPPIPPEVQEAIDELTLPWAEREHKRRVECMMRLLNGNTP